MEDMMRGYDFSPYRRSTVGFDRLFDFLESASRAEQDNYPPFDIEKLGDDSYRITLAVAGFKREEIEIVAHQNMLTITGRRGDDRAKDGNYLHMGIATRAFERKFELADFVRVTAAGLSDGLLRIELAREVPEAMKPRKIDIGGDRPATIEAVAA
jgi:molecular chaperone IbpA